MTSEIRAEERPEVYTSAEVEQGMTWMIAGAVFSSAFASIVGAGFAAFLTKILKVGDLAFGVINAAGPAAVLFLFIGSLVMERTGRTKRAYLAFTLPYRFSWLGIAAIPLVFHHFPNLWATGAVGLIIFLGSAGANYGGAGVAVWLAALVPKSGAGRYFALRSTAGLWSMILAGFVAGQLLGRFPDTPRAYSVAFAVAAVFGVIDLFCYTRVPERPRPVEPDRPSIWSIVAVPWKNHLFRSFSLYSAITWFSYAMMSTFILPFCFDSVAKKGLGLGIFASILFISIIPMISMAFVTPLWGMAIDRFGPKPVLGIGSVSAAVLPFVWLFIHAGGGTPINVGPWTVTPDLLWLIPVFQIIGGITWPAVEQGVFYVQIHGFPEAKRSAYIASYGVVLQIASMVGSIVAGWLAGFWMLHMRDVPFFPKWFSHYQPVFLIAILIRLGAFVFLYPRLRLEGTAEYHEVAKSVASEAKAVVPNLVRKRRNRPKPEA